MRFNTTERGAFLPPLKLFLLSWLFAASVHAYAQVPAQLLPEFKFFRQNNTVFTNADLPKDQFLFFIFIDPGCDHCRQAVKHISRQYSSFKQTAFFLISQESFDKLDHFISAYAPALKNKKNVLLLRDSLLLFISRFKPYRFPAMFLYSPGKKLIDYEDNEESVFRFVTTINNAMKKN